jgi:iron complex outermembrane receptor protein
MILSPRAAAAATALTHACVYAQTAVAPVAAPTTLPEVVVTAGKPGERLGLDDPQSTGSRLPVTAREMPASIHVIGRATIDQHGAASTQEILAHAPGLTFSAPPGAAGSVSMRGFSGSQITQLFNGITVQYDSVAARPVDSWIYDRVEIIGGPSSFLFGAGAVGGAINYLTRTPQPDADFIDAQAGYGSFNSANLAVSVNRRLSGTEGGVRNTARLDVNRSQTDGFVQNSRRVAINSAASLLTEIDTRWSHLLAIEYQREDVARPYWGTPLLNPTQGTGRIDPETRFRNYNAADGLYQQTVSWLRSVAEYKPSAATTVRNTLYRYDALRDWRNVEVYRFTADNAQVIRSSPLLQRHDQSLTGNRVELTHRGSLFGRPSDWASGLDASVNRQTRFPRSLTLNVSTVDPYQFATESFFSIPGMSEGFVPDRSNRVTTLAMFVENRTRVSDRLALISGLRGERIELEVTNRRTVSSNDPAYFKNVYTPFTGRVGAVYALTPAANVYAQFSTAADPPAGILSTANFSQVRDFGLTTGRQFEVGSKLDFMDGRGTATVAAYRITRRNLAMADPSNPGTTLPVGQQSAQGVELAGSLRVSPTLLVQGNLALGSARFDEFTENVNGVAVSRAGNLPPNVPRRVANLWLTWQVSPSLAAGLDLRHVSARFGNTANTLSDGAYTLIGASATYRVDRRTSIVLRGRNLGDKTYAASIVGAPMFFLGAPRSVDLTVRTSF